MDGLRWLLLLVGLFVVAGVYLYTRFQRGANEDSPDAENSSDRVEPLLGCRRRPRDGACHRW